MLYVSKTKKKLNPGENKMLKEDESTNSLFVIADNGSGKSHLIQKTVHKIQRLPNCPNIIYVTCEQYFILFY